MERLRETLMFPREEAPPFVQAETLRSPANVALVAHLEIPDPTTIFKTMYIPTPPRQERGDVEEAVEVVAGQIESEVVDRHTSHKCLSTKKGT